MQSIIHSINQSIIYSVAQSLVRLPIQTSTYREDFNKLFVRDLAALVDVVHPEGPPELLFGIALTGHAD